MTWVDVAVRAAGRAAHLLDEPALAALEATRDRALLDEELRASRQRAAEDLVIADRWASHRRSALAVIFDDEDRRSVRALVRGLAAGVSADHRFAAVLPTPDLPEHVLRDLADAPSLAELAAGLALRAHPLAPALAVPAGGDAPSLVALELAMARIVIARARRVRRGGAAVAGYVEQLVDGENATSALELAARGQELVAADAFLDGGRHLTRTAFLAAAAASSDEAARLLARAFAGTPLAAAFEATEPDAVDDALLAWQVATQTSLRRVDPTGLAPLFALVLRRRGELRRIRRAVWRRALAGGAP